MNRVKNQLASHPSLSAGLGFLSIILQFLSLVFGFVFLGFKNDFGGNGYFVFNFFGINAVKGAVL